LGQSVFTRDESIKAKFPPLLGGNSIIELFGSDEPLTVPNGGEIGEGLRVFPRPGGFRFQLFTYPPGLAYTGIADALRAQGDVDDETKIAETELLSPGLTDVMSDEHGMHWTSTVDLEYVVSGEFTLTLDSGESRVLKAGDTVVHCGEKHAWSNEGTEPATMLVVFVGAELDSSRFHSGPDSRVAAG